jgi:hypothetical protein
MTAADRLRKMQESLSRHEAEFLAIRPQPGQKEFDRAKLDGLVAEIRRIRLEIDALLNLPPSGRPRPVPKGRPKPMGLPRPGQEPRGRAPDWRGKPDGPPRPRR